MWHLKISFNSFYYLFVLLFVGLSCQWLVPIINYIHELYLASLTWFY